MLGFINVYKPQGITSSAVVQKIKKKFNIKKIGHMGTLDPIAQGVLPIAIGKATRLFDYALDKVKTYEVVYDFGYTTDTLDITGKVTCENGMIPNSDNIKNIIATFLGEQEQIPPDFSAKCVNGRRAYALAREGVEFTLKSKLIKIYEFKLLNKLSNNQFKFSITCSSGTYIRAIGRDLAEKLGTFACMSFLERVETNNFKSTDAILLDDLLKLSNLDTVLKSPLQVFDKFDIKEIDLDTFNKLKNGIRVDLGKLDNNTFIIYNNELIGIIKPTLKAEKLDTYLYE